MVKRAMSAVLFIAVFLCPGISFPAQSNQTVQDNPGITKEEEMARQQAVIAIQKIEAEQKKTNAEIEEMRLQDEEETAESLKQAEIDLKASIEAFQKEEFPVKISEENTEEEE